MRVRMGLHTGEPQLGEHGYVGIDVVRAARICSAGHGGQILLSETTRALLGNALPTGACVLDLGQQNLKDIQHERIFQLSLDEQPREKRPLKTADASPGEPGSRAEAMAASFETRITDFVERQLERQMESAASKIEAGEQDRASAPPPLVAPVDGYNLQDKHTGATRFRRGRFSGRVAGRGPRSAS